MSNPLTPGASTAIAHNCTIATTGNNHPLRPSETLGDYGVSTDDQILLIKNRIRTNSAIGLPRFGHTIDPNALKDLDTSWTIMMLADVIFDNAFVSPDAEEAFAASESVVALRGAGGAVRPRAGALVEMVRQNPIPALVVTAAVAMLTGFMMGRARL